MDTCVRQTKQIILNSIHFASSIQKRLVTIFVKVKNLHFSEANQIPRYLEFWIWTNPFSCCKKKKASLNPCSDREWCEGIYVFFLAHFDQTFLPIDWSAISNEKLGAWPIKVLQWKNVLIVNCSLVIILACHLSWGTDSLPFSTFSLGDRKTKVFSCNTLACMASEQQNFCDNWHLLSLGEKPKPGEVIQLAGRQTSVLSHMHLLQWMHN